MKMKAVVKGHLDGLGKEISSLIEKSKPGSETALASWTKNSDEIDVALKVIGAVSFLDGGRYRFPCPPVQYLLRSRSIINCCKYLVYRHIYLAPIRR